jgi:hypothetical protein
MDCINVTDSEVTIQLTDYIKHDGYVHHLPELYRTLYQLTDVINTRTVRFMSHETEPFRMVAFDRVLEHLALSMAIPKHRLILDTYDHVPRFETPWATVVVRPSTSLTGAVHQIAVDKCVRDPNARLFGGFFGRFTPHRFLMAHFLETEMSQHSVVAFQPKLEWAEYEFESVKKWFVKELDWLRHREEKNTTIEGGYNGRVDGFNCLPDYHNIFSLYQIEIVIETNVYECGWWTEKTAKCLASGKPFILIGTQTQLVDLRNLGFKTFSPWINESYDLEINPERRFDMIKDEIRRLASLEHTLKQEMLSKINAIADYNKNNYKNLINDYHNKSSR